MHRITQFALACLLLPTSALAAEYHGLVTFGGLPVPGATVTATQGDKRVATVSDQGGLYTFPDLADGSWRIAIEMQCFSTIQADVAIVPNAPAGKWEMKLLPLDQLLARTKLMPETPPVAPAVLAATAPATKDSTKVEVPEIPRPTEEQNQQSADGFLINGSVNNAATSQFSLDRAFGNQRYSRRQYNGGISLVFRSSAFDARPYSLSGIAAPRPSYNDVTGGISFGGPIIIPHLLRRGPSLTLNYLWTRNNNASILSGLVPTAAERAGDLSGIVNALGQHPSIFDPLTGKAFPGNIVPVSPQAQALLQLYPLPNLAGTPLYNYQVPRLNSSHQDALQSRVTSYLKRVGSLNGSFNYQSARSGGANFFGFNDTTDTMAIGTIINWSHSLPHRIYLSSSYSFNRDSTRVVPFYQNRQNISSKAGIAGNNQEPANWGPPSLSFSSGIRSLSDGQSSFDRTRIDGVSVSASMYGRHNITIGGDLHKQEFNYYSQQNPRGGFTFTGAVTQGAGNNVTTNNLITGGSDFADFLLGVPDTSSIAFGNADKYLRQPVYDAYFADDWRVLSVLTINAGVRWEYGAPMTELHGRLVNLDVARGFTAVTPVLGRNPIGALTGSHYPNSLVRPDRLGVEPRIGISWRPVPASTIVIRAGYGIYRDTSSYSGPVQQLIQQAPLSKSLNVQNSAACPLTLANGFNSCPSITANTFAIDPEFRVGYVHTWQLAVQRDLPAALQLSATYLGIKGTRGAQQFLPNTYPIGAVNPCPSCPSGFVYETSGANSTHQAALLQIRRRLRSGFSATALYTWSKSIDDASFLGGQGTIGVPSSTEAGGAPSFAGTPGIAQNWLNLRGERSLSAFDQRHLLNLIVTYTSGEAIGGRSVMGGWTGRLLGDWTVLTTIAAGSGLPETPAYFATVTGTGFTGSIRPNRTGAPIYTSHSPGGHLNAAAYTAPLPGQWGTAGRNTITGPNQFSLNSSLQRSFHTSARTNIDARVEATNVLNHGVYSSWYTTVNSTQFGLPLAVNPMRSLQTKLSLRF